MAQAVLAEGAISTRVQRTLQITRKKAALHFSLAGKLCAQKKEAPVTGEGASEGGVGGREGGT